MPTTPRELPATFAPDVVPHSVQVVRDGRLDGQQREVQLGVVDGIVNGLIASGGVGKKKKKKKKKVGLVKQVINNESKEPTLVGCDHVHQSPVLRISRNKHMKYISAYHGPWLQLPLELLQSLLTFNNSSETVTSLSPFRLNSNQEYNRLLHNSQPLSLSNHSLYPQHQLFDKETSWPSRSLRELAKDPNYSPGKSGTVTNKKEFNIPPPIDHAVFMVVTEIRRLVEEATSLAIKASSNVGVNFDGGGGGRSTTLSPVRQHRLRLLAVSKLASAYRIDEIAASVSIMQGSSALDDLAERVLKIEPNNKDARYVHFFHEKIPSQTLAESTGTEVLEQLINENPHQLEYYRTLGVINGYKQDYKAAIRNFTHALLQAKAARRAKHWHTNDVGKSSKKKSNSRNHASTSVCISESEHMNNQQTITRRDEKLVVGITPGDDTERQIIFLRGMAYFHYASSTIEEAILAVENVSKPSGGLSNETGEPSLEALRIKLSIPEKGLFGNAEGLKSEEYKKTMRDPTFVKKVTTLLRKCIRDQERFLTFFPVSELPPGSIFEDDKRLNHPRGSDKNLTFRGRRLIHYRCLSGRSSFTPRRTDGLNSEPALLTTYHPLLIESHFTIILCKLLLGDYTSLIHSHTRAIRLMESLESQPIFIPARSLSQSQYVELMERLAIVWLPQREANGEKIIQGNDFEIEIQGSLSCLQYLTSFFTKRHSLLLEKQFLAAEQEVREESRAKSNGNNVLSLLDVTRRSENLNGTSSTNSSDKGVETVQVTTTARSEMALAWLMASVIPRLENEDVNNYSNGSGSGGGLEDEEVE